MVNIANGPVAGPRRPGRPHTGRPRDGRIDAAVPAAVMAILGESGYAGLTLEAVAARAGTSKPALRRRWPSRQHLVVDALVATVPAAPAADTGCTHCDLVAGIGALGQAFGAPLGRRVLPALAADLADTPELESAFLDRFFHPRRAPAADALRRGIRRGEVRADADIDLLLDMLVSTTSYRVLFGHLPATPALAEQVVKVVMAGAATAPWRCRRGRGGPG
ncbi:TetR/AcrR family transcriptional regulator [Streptomyces sp. NPDC046215]